MTDARVLALTNLYPPHHLGGYEVVHHGCDRWLRAHGTTVRVLTTDHREPGVADGARSAATTADEVPDRDGDVHRELRWYWHDHEFPRRTVRERVALERHNHRVLHRHLDAFRPDVAVLWAMGGMSLSLIGALERARVPIVSVVHDLWPAYGPLVDGFARPLARLGAIAGPIARAIGSDRPRGPRGTVLLNSHSLAGELGAAGVLPPEWTVVPPGIEVPDAVPAPGPWRGRLLVLGRLDPRKGVDVAIDALRTTPAGTTLTVAGGGDAREGEALRRRAAAAGLGDRVRFVGAVARERIPALLADHDALVFPVRWAEPFGLVPLEAMAHAVPVIATATGGQAEYLRDGDNALVVPADDPGAVGAAVRRLAADAALRERLVAEGRSTARANGEDVFHARIAAAIGEAAAARG
ncbi:MAG: glycosyltransferase family 4 protein [Solirubrobacteraceae bacterium]